MKPEITINDIALDILVKEKFMGDYPLFDTHNINYYEITDGVSSMQLSEFLDQYTLRIIEIFKECLHGKFNYIQR